jgi:hypothetical protein
MACMYVPSDIHTYVCTYIEKAMAVNNGTHVLIHMSLEERYDIVWFDVERKNCFEYFSYLGSANICNLQDNF